MDYRKKEDILNKIFKLIKLYLEVNRMKKYITRDIVPDEDGNSYVFIF